MFNKSKKNTYKPSKKIPLYAPEKPNTDPYSTWRKPDTSYLDSPLAKRHLEKFYITIARVSNIITILLGIVVFVLIIKLTLFTRFDYTVIYDGTALNCFIDESGKVLPLVKTK